MALADEIASFADGLARGSDVIKTEIDTFPSGAVFLLIRASGRLFTFDYLPSQAMFGVDELEADAGFNSGYRFGFEDFRSAKAKLLELLEEARTVPAHDSQEFPR